MRKYFNIASKVSQAFRPSAPIDDPNLFVGRVEERRLLAYSLFSPGRHAAVYGSRGVGKTSLVNIVAKDVSKELKSKIISHRCSHRDSFFDIFFDLLKAAGVVTEPAARKTKFIDDLGAKVKVPFFEASGKTLIEEEHTFCSTSKSSLTPHFIARAFAKKHWIFVIDEYDRIFDKSVKSLVAETIKHLSDESSETKVILTGVATAAKEIIGAQELIVRNIATLPIGVMPNENLRTILEEGAKRISLSFSEDSVREILSLSLGLPYFTHLLGEQVAIRCIENGSKVVELDGVYEVIKHTISLIHEDIQKDFEAAGIAGGSSFYRPSIVSIASIVNQEGEPPISTDPIIRMLVLEALSLYDNCNENILEKVAQIVRAHQIPKEQLEGFDYADVLATLESFDYADVLVALEDISQISDILVEDNGQYMFREPILHAYGRLRAAKAFGKKYKVLRKESS